MAGPSPTKSVTVIFFQIGKIDRLKESIENIHTSIMRIQFIVLFTCLTTRLLLKNISFFYLALKQFFDFKNKRIRDVFSVMIIIIIFILMILYDIIHLKNRTKKKKHLCEMRRNFTMEFFFFFFIGPFAINICFLHLVLTFICSFSRNRRIVELLFIGSPTQVFFFLSARIII